MEQGKYWSLLTSNPRQGWTKSPPSEGWNNKWSYYVVKLLFDLEQPRISHNHSTDQDGECSLFSTLQTRSVVHTTEEYYLFTYAKLQGMAFGHLKTKGVMIESISKNTQDTTQQLEFIARVTTPCRSYVMYPSSRTSQCQFNWRNDEMDTKNPNFECRNGS